MTKQNVITKVLLKDGDKELSKALKVKIMRMSYNKIKQQFNADVQEFTKELIPVELQILASKIDRSKEENKKFEELNNKVNSEYHEFLIQKGNEEITSIDDSLTFEEYSNIVDVNSGNDVEINSNIIKAADFLEIIIQNKTACVNIISKKTLAKEINIMNCEKLYFGEIIFPEGVRRIGGYAFYGNTSITKIEIPEVTWYIGEYSFASCNNLLSVYCKPKEPAGL